MSGIQLPECSKMVINQKSDNDITICWHDNVIKFSWCCFVSIVTLSYCSKFHVNVIACSWVMIIFFYKGLTRNPEIRNTPICVLPYIWGLVWAANTKFSTNISNKMLPNAAKYQGYSFYRFWLIKGKPTRG